MSHIGKNINLQYYRFRPEKARALPGELEPLLTAELQSLSGFRERSLATLDKADEAAVLRLFGAFRDKLADFFALDEDGKDTLIESMRANLSKGNFKFVVLMDKLEDRLKGKDTLFAPA